MIEMWITVIPARFYTKCQFFNFATFSYNYVGS